LGRVIHDDQLTEHLRRIGERWLDEGRGTPASNLLAQLERRSCAIHLPRPGKQRLPAEQVAARARAGTLVVAGIYQCRHCPQFHVSAGAGFVLNASGAIATCHHLVAESGVRQFVVMTGEGRCFPVREILAADAVNDVVILQLDTGGAKLTPLPLETNAAVGGRVFVLGHPESHFYTFTEGLLARYFTGQSETGAAEMMSITADFAPGSSGCPIFDERGNVIGMADNIVKAGLDDEKSQGPSIVFKHCRPAAAIRALVRPEKRKP
jgi:S1-C subfamily serine protease